MTRHGIIKEKMIKVLLEQPNTWFDNTSMAYTIGTTVNSVLRIRNELRKKSLIIVKQNDRWNSKKKIHYYFKCRMKGFVYG